MNFRIADTFTASLARLTGREQRAVKTTAFDLQLDPANSGLQFHRLNKARDPNFWSVRVNQDIRLIVHKTAADLLLAYVDHHDRAYAWAERRRIERHPRTGAAQLVEIRETVRDIETVAAPAPDVADEMAIPCLPALFLNLGADELLGIGVPEDWVDEVYKASEDSFFELAEHLPAEAVEALLTYATTGALPTAAVIAGDEDLFAHPDAARRFRLLENVEELERALNYPWEKWTIFLHPAQRRFVERDYNGPARISGSAGTGKTVVALHRAVRMAKRHTDAQVLLTTFSRILANALRRKLARMVGNEDDVARRITVQALSIVGHDLHAAAFGQPNLAPPALLAKLLRDAAAARGKDFSDRFLLAEWREVVDAWRLTTWEAYRDVARLGRKTRIGGRQRESLWSIFEAVQGELARRKLVTRAEVFGRLADHYQGGVPVPYDVVVVDESQDISIPELRFLASLGAGRTDALYFVGDLGQRIFQQPFSWKSLGVDVRGRSHTLRVCYRTSHQIRTHADRLLPDAIADVDGNEEGRRGAVSVFNGPRPRVAVFADEADEVAGVTAWLMDLIGDGARAHEIGLFIRTTAEMRRARAVAKAAGLAFVELSETVEGKVEHLSLATMHLAKGLEFRAVAVMACDDEILPSQERIEAVVDESDLGEVYETERHLLYVACTRARDYLHLSGIAPVSEFIDDIHADPSPPHLQVTREDGRFM